MDLTEPTGIPGGPDDVPWDTLEDLDGPGTEVPGLPAEAFNAAPQRAVEAIAEIADRVDAEARIWSVVVETDLLSSVVPALLPFLVRLASERERPEVASVR